MLEKRAFTINEIIKFAPIGRSSIYKAISERRLIARKCGRRTLVLAADFEAFLKRLPELGAEATTSDSVV